MPSMTVVLSVVLSMRKNVPADWERNPELVKDFHLIAGFFKKIKINENFTSLHFMSQSGMLVREGLCHIG